MTLTGVYATYKYIALSGMPIQVRRVQRYFGVPPVYVELIAARSASYHVSSSTWIKRDSKLKLDRSMAQGGAP